MALSDARSLALCRRAGLAEVRRFAGPGDRVLVEMARALWTAPRVRPPPMT